jgi:hypothetical protein
MILPYESSIGNWKLLYTSNNNLINNNLINNNYFNINNIELEIFPIKDNEISVTIKRCESNNFIRYTKIIKCKAYYNDCEKNDMCNVDIEYLNNGEICSLIILKSEKFIKSIGIFEFPYFYRNYITELNPKYYIIYKVDTKLNRLYIYFDKNKYVFERNLKNKLYIKEERITTNIFLITNLISFYLGKILEKIIHIN